MDRTIDDIFVKDFKRMLSNRGNKYGRDYSLEKMPLPPELQRSLRGIPKRRYAYIKGIKEPFFSSLNKETVEILGRMNFKEVFKLKGDVTLNRGSVAILSSKNIGLQKYIEIEGVKRKHEVTDGFNYVHYVNTPTGRKYIYFIPKEFVYRLNTCALILRKWALPVNPNSTNAGFYSGYRIALQNGGHIFIYVIPFKYSERLTYRVLGVKLGIDFEEEIAKLIEFWLSQNLIFNYRISYLEEPINGIINPSIVTLDPNLNESDYVPYTISMAEENETEFYNSLD